MREGGPRSGQDGEHSTGLDLIRRAVSGVLLAEMSTLWAELKNDLQEFHTGLREDIKKQMDEFSKEINRRLQEATDREEEMAGQRTIQWNQDVGRWELRKHLCNC